MKIVQGARIWIEKRNKKQKRNKNTIKKKQKRNPKKKTRKANKNYKRK